MTLNAAGPAMAVPVVCEWSRNYQLQYASVRLARMNTRQSQTLVGWSGDVEDAALIVSELASNAVSHGMKPGCAFTVRMAVLEDNALVIDVSDPIGAFPCFGEPAEPEQDEERGRGLLLVQRLGADLSWALDGNGGKVVRAHMAGSSDARLPAGYPARLRQAALRHGASE